MEATPLHRQSMATQRTPTLDSMPKIQRWIGKKLGQRLSIGQVLEWLESEEAGDLKDRFHSIVVRDTVRLGTIDNVSRLGALGYDLKRPCSYQVDGGALHVAAQYNRQAHAQVLVDQGLSVTHRLFPSGPSPLDEALTNGHLALFEKLLAQAGEVNEDMRDGFLISAVSAKIHAPGKGKNHDLMKRKVVEYVLDNFGPCQQSQLNAALYSVGQHAWISTAQALIDRGADPAAPVSFTASWGSGQTSALLRLFSCTHPRKWDQMLDMFIHHTEALFPSSPTQQRVWGLEDMAWAAHAYSSRYKEYNLPQLVEKAQAQRLNQRMEERLAQGTTRSPKVTPRL